jgi:hypothetical protein
VRRTADSGGFCTRIDPFGRAKLWADQVQVLPRGADMAVAEQLLDGEQVHWAFEQVGGETMAQRVDAPALGDPGTLACTAVGTLRHAHLHRAAGAGVGEQPSAGAHITDIGAQQFEQRAIQYAVA